MTDQQLLQRFLRNDEHAAFAELVERHSGLVLAVATRFLGDRSMAEDVAQNVFILLADKAARLANHPTLVGWLHRTAYYEATKVLQSTTRRQRREQNYHDCMTSESASALGSSWEQVLPHLDQAMDKLSLRDRNLLLLRFYQKKSFREIANLLGKSEAACRMRGSRAVEKLGKLLQRGGVALPTAVLANGFHASYADAAASQLSPALAQQALATASPSSISPLGALLPFNGGGLAVATGVAVITGYLVLRPHDPAEASIMFTRGDYPPTLELATTRQAGAVPPDTTQQPVPAPPGEAPAPGFQLVFEDNWNEELLASRFVDQKDRPRFKMVDWPDWPQDLKEGGPGTVRLSPRAIAYAGIRTVEVAPLERALHWLWAEATKLANAHTVIDPHWDAPEAGLRAIRIAPFDATELLQTYLHHVESVVGPKRALKLLSTFYDHQWFGSFGRLEIQAQIDERSKPPKVSYSRHDPHTGRRLGGGENYIGGFEAWYGKLATPRADGPATSWKPPRPNKAREIEVFDESGILTTVAIEAIGITTEQSLRLQASIEAWFKEMSTLMREHVSPEPNGDPQVTQFKVAPFPVRGAAALQQFQEDIESQIGTGPSAKFLTMLEPEQYFCGCGQRSLEVTFSDQSFANANVPADPNGVRFGHRTRAKYQEVDAKTNETDRSGQTTYRLFKKRYGDFLTTR